ncbi:Uu.00g096500.m01.CDS01 [Anthostomella pinea]|uniref:Uu.00g096500.m01.CDS01 n=1 Tax=Anthostomella pinea TaxID=933095 RepID=A0AAI8VD79_9PEZI|nr:Uu.00g096500.m01.CDS01 [Anthostomella pinea]
MTHGKIFDSSSSHQSTVLRTSLDQKTKKVNEAQENLPLPEQPPVASDWNSADARTVNVGSGGVSSDISTGAGSTSGLREPASKGDVDLSNVGREGKDNLSGPPKDAAAR